jgi:hypothetical protein
MQGGKRMLSVLMGRRGLVQEAIVAGSSSHPEAEGGSRRRWVSPGVLAASIVADLVS